MGDRQETGAAPGSACPVGRRRMLKAVALLCTAPCLVRAAAAEDAARSDYSAILTRAAADGLVRTGALARIRFLPAELGGSAHPRNIGYVPPQAAEAHALRTDRFARYFQQDLIDRLEVTPEYKGDSIVPTRILWRAWNDRSAESFESAMEVWRWSDCMDAMAGPVAQGRNIDWL
jgi:hypothetical protein